jgi:phage shock protein A
MAMPALLLESEDPVEERVARLEVNVEHIRSDISDMKVDIRRLGDKIDNVDQKLSAKIDSVDQKLSTKIDSVVQSIAELRIGRALDRVWWLLMSGALLGIMARAFKWI